MKDRVGNGCVFGFKGFENQEEALVVCRSECGECGDFLEGLIVFDICELEGSDEGGKTLCAES